MQKNKHVYANLCKCMALYHDLNIFGSVTSDGVNAGVSDCGSNTSTVLGESTYHSQMSLLNWWCRFQNGRFSLGFLSESECY